MTFEAWTVPVKQLNKYQSEFITLASERKRQHKIRIEFFVRGKLPFIILRQKRWKNEQFICVIVSDLCKLGNCFEALEIVLSLGENFTIIEILTLV